MSDVGGRGGRRVGRARCRLVVVGVSCVVQRAGHPTTSKEYICAEAPSLLARLGVRAVSAARLCTLFPVLRNFHISLSRQPDKTLTNNKTSAVRSAAVNIQL